MPPHINKPPSAPDHLRGVFDHRGRIVPVYDTRKLMGYPSYLQERDALIALLHQREQDHRKWLTELEQATLEQRPFTLQRDPHKCAFGKWYDANRQTISENIEIRLLLGQFDTPHQRIHAVADQIDRCVRINDFEQAKEILTRTRSGPLARLLALFSELYRVTEMTFADHEVGLIHYLPGQIIMLTADKVIGVQPLYDITPLPVTTTAPTRALGKDASQQIVQIIDCTRILHTTA